MLKNHLLQKRLFAYSAAAGIALAGGVALADTNEINSVVIRDIDPDVTLSDGSGEVFLDIDQDMNNEARIIVSTQGGQPKVQMFRLDNGGDFLHGYYTEKNGNKVYEPGDTIPGGDPGGTTLDQNSAMSIFINDIGSVSNSTFGIKFNLSGSEHFGWVRFSSTPTTITVEGYGYETTPNTPITAPNAGPLAVTLANFAAIANGTDVSVTWSTVSEQDNLGFNLYRSSDLAELGTQLNAELIPAQTPGSGQGSTYDYLDENLAAGSYFYTLEDVDVNGTPTRHAPVSVTIGQTTAVALNQLESSDESSPLGLLVAGGALAAVAVAARRRRTSND